jgi:hypothetical protein
MQVGAIIVYPRLRILESNRRAPTGDFVYHVSVDSAQDGRNEPASGPDVVLVDHDVMAVHVTRRNG